MYYVNVDHAFDGGPVLDNLEISRGERAIICIIGYLIFGYKSLLGCNECPK